MKGGEKDAIIRGELTPNGYSLIDIPRSGRTKGGGVAVILRSSLKVKQQKVTNKSSFEAIEVLITSKSDIIRLCVVYKPPVGSKTAQPTSVFLDEFSDYIDEQSTTSGKLLVVGDFNFHVGDSKNNDSEPSSL